MESRVCTNCGDTFYRKPGWSTPVFERTKFCSITCANLGRWRGPDGEAYRKRLGAARRAFNVANPEANRERLAKTAATRGAAFPALDTAQAGRTTAARLVRMKQCANCGVPYRGARSLHRHHRNGDPTDNDLENIVVLCPACHATFHDALGHGYGRPRVKPRVCRICGRSFRPERNRQVLCSAACQRENLRRAQPSGVAARWLKHQPAP